MSLAGGTNAKQDLIDKIAKVEEAKAGVNKELNGVNQRLQTEQEQIDSLSMAMRRIDSTQGTLEKDITDNEAKLQQVEEEKLEKDEQIKQLKEEVMHQEELISKLNREKRNINDSKQKDEENVQSYEDKCNHLGKLKMRLERQLDEASTQQLFSLSLWPLKARHSPLWALTG